MKIPFAKAKTAKEPKEPVEDVARHTLLQYLQSWGQTLEERGEVLIAAGRWCGFDCKLEVADGQVIPQVGGGTDEEAAENLRLWKEFRAAIERCWPIGSWEEEYTAVRDVLWHFRDRLSSP